MPELVPTVAAEPIDAAALLVAVLCWGVALSPAAGFWGLYNQRVPPWLKGWAPQTT